MPRSSASPGARAEKTRAAILQAAEAIFAERGFAATRLEDVAEAVGIRRASIVYYYRDKRELYDAVLEDVFTSLYDSLAVALRGAAPFEQRLEDAVVAWVDAVGARPTIARLILREVADATPDRAPGMVALMRPFFDLVETGIYGADDFDESRLNAVDPVHIASTIAGATIFFVAATPTLLPELDVDPVSEAHLSAHREQVLRILRRLLGTRGPRPA